MATNIIVVEPGMITKHNKAQLEKQGLIVIEAKDVSKVKIIGVEPEVQSSDMVLALLEGINSCLTDDPSRKFTESLYEKLKNRKS